MLLAASLTAGGALALDADAATKKGRSKARTSQTSKSKKHIYEITGFHSL